MSQMIHLFIICLLLIFSNSYAKSQVFQQYLSLFLEICRMFSNYFVPFLMVRLRHIQFKFPFPLCFIFVDKSPYAES